MNPKKQKEKDRRRARKLADKAWEAANAGNLDLAEKIIRRAVSAQEGNSVLWNDQGRILHLRQKVAEAAESFRTALSLAPTFADPYAQLAAMRVRHGSIGEAVALQTQALKYAPENLAHAEKLEAYLALAGDELPEPRPQQPAAFMPSEPSETEVDWQARFEELDWHFVGERLTRDGCVVISSLMDPETCQRLRRMFANEALFARSVVMDRPQFGLGEYRYFKAPIPETVDRLRRAAYPHLARVVNRWQTLLGDPRRFPADWQTFRDECHADGQTTPTPILLRYGPGGWNALHRDLRGSIFFPVQMAVVLSCRAETSDAAGDGFCGGEFLFCDVPEGRKSLRREIPAELGDVLFFCTRDRLVRVGGVYGLQAVKHGVAPITAGERIVLGVPFHEYR